LKIAATALDFAAATSDNRKGLATAKGLRTSSCLFVATGHGKRVETNPNEKIRYVSLSKKKDDGFQAIFLRVKNGWTTT
jgi:hypothetical protein